MTEFKLDRSSFFHLSERVRTLLLFSNTKHLKLLLPMAVLTGVVRKPKLNWKNELSKNISL